MLPSIKRLAWSWLFASLASAQTLIPVPIPAPNSDSTAKYVEQWRDSRLGLFIHWGPVSQQGLEIGWSRGVGISSGAYDNLAKTFNPTGFDAKEWVALAKAGGMKYITLTTKHHDGFSLWDTKYSDYNIMSTPFGRDVTKELSEECRRQGIRFDAYYSIMDWYQPDYGPAGVGGPGYPLPAGTQPTMSRYLAYLKNQVTELVDNYHPDVLWFDGDWDPTWDKSFGAGLYGLVKSRQPGIVVNNRLSGEGDGWTGQYPKAPGDFFARERSIGGFNLSIPWETSNTIAEQWSYKPGNTLRPTRAYLLEMLDVLGGGGNYLLNIGPGPDGKFPAREADKLRAIGAWTTAHGEGVYGTRGGPYLPGNWGAATRKGDKVYLHILNWPEDDAFNLPPLPQKILAYRRLGGGIVSVAQTDSTVQVTVPRAGRDTLAETIELTLAGAVKGPLPDPVNSLGMPAAWISRQAAFHASSAMPQYASSAADLFQAEDFGADFSFHTQLEDSPSIVVDLGKVMTVKGLDIFNRSNWATANSAALNYQDRAKTLTAWSSENGSDWIEIWRADSTRAEWSVAVKGMAAGNPVAGRNARYIKLGLRERNYFHLANIKIYGDPEPDRFTSLSVGQGSAKRGEKIDLGLEMDRNVLRYSLSVGGPAKLELLDVGGRRIALLAEGVQAAGSHQVTWPVRVAGAGIYKVRLTAGGKSLVRNWLRLP